MSGKNDELEKVIGQYSSMLYKICFLILKNEQDTKDVLQETFLTFYIKKPTFYSDEHRKAWLIIDFSHRIPLLFILCPWIYGYSIYRG
ncbi:MAG: hypothetical protein K6B69_06040 [Lachnospiraceae bacterium]|nr:hypothetical protein [Lachnospiraceae bacterium]